MSYLAILLAVIVVAVITLVAKGIVSVPQSRVAMVERFGKYKATLEPGLNLINPLFDKVAYKLDLREQVVSFPPQPVITQDNLTVNVDTVIYFTVIDPIRATYEISNYISAVEQITMTTLRNIVGALDLEQTLTSRDHINTQLMSSLAEATGKWGLRVNRVELKSIDPPASILEAMQKQMRADRDKRAAILDAEGQRQSVILTAEGEKQSAILRAQASREAQILEAEGDRQSRILRAQGEAQAIIAVSQAIHDGNPDQKLLAYKYLETLPQIANGANASTWVVPAELTKFLNGFTTGVGSTDPRSIIPADGGGVSEEHRLNLDQLGKEFSDDAINNTSATDAAAKIAEELSAQTKKFQPMSTKSSAYGPAGEGKSAIVRNDRQSYHENLPKAVQEQDNDMGRHSDAALNEKPISEQRLSDLPEESVKDFKDSNGDGFPDLPELPNA